MTDAGRDAGSETPQPPERDPDMSENDRFFLNGKSMPFAAWAQAVMEAIEPREAIEPQPQPGPESPEVVWMARRPIER